MDKYLIKANCIHLAPISQKKLKSNLSLKSEFFSQIFEFFLKFEKTQISAFHKKILVMFFTQFEKKLKLPP